MARVATSLILVSAVLTLLLAGTNALAEPDRDRMEEPFEITADEIRYDETQGLYVADGRVRIVQGERRLRARWVAFSTRTRLGAAEGDIELIDAGDELRAQFMVFDVDTLQGMLYQGEIDAGSRGFRVQAREMIRTGPQTFETRDGVFTTCRCPDEDAKPPWTIKAGDADVELGGYGTVTNGTFNVLGVPVLWIPWAFFPIKSERETGLLLPTITFGGRGGASVGLPFFWAAHPQLNVTLTPSYFTERGYKQDVELEYVFGKRSGGQLFVAGLDDSENTAGARNDRWALLWDHDHDLPGGIRWQTDLNLNSDNVYADDFIEMREFRAHRFIESTSNLARDFGDSGAFGALLAVRYADDQQGVTQSDRDEILLQRLPELRSDVLPGALDAPLGVDFRLDSELIYFTGFDDAETGLTGFPPGEPLSRSLRNDGRFFDVGFNGFFDGSNVNGENDGIFQSGEPLAEQGARVMLHPRLARSFQLGSLLEISPEIGWQQTLYRSTGQRFAERGLFTARTEIRSRLARDYRREDGRVTRHVLEPRLGWALVSQRGQRDNPRFIPEADSTQTRLRALALENVSRNPSDRTRSANQVVLALGQRFFNADGPRATPRLRADVVTAIDYNFSESDGLGSILLDGRVFPGFVGARFRLAFDPEAVAFEEGGIDLSVNAVWPERFFRRAKLTGGYRYLRRPPLFFETDVASTSSIQASGQSEVNQLDFEAQVEIAWRLRFTYAGIYGLEDSDTGFIRNRGMVEYVSKCRCWGIGLQLENEKRNGIQYGLTIRFLGLGDERSNLFDGGLGAGVNL